MSDMIDNESGEVTHYEPQEVSGAVAAEISQQVATAKRYPRRPDKAIATEIMSRATLDEETAAECCYSLPRAGKDIVGPSVRFAELVFASYGNMRAGARFVELDTKDPLRSAVIIEGVCIDMQMNNGQTVPVRRSITGKKGVFNADMTNIAFSAGAAIARREAILKTVPKSIWGAAWKQVLAVLQGDQRTLASRRQASLEAFKKMGVEPARVFAALDVAGEEAITLEHMPRLIGMWTALRDGTETIESTFGRGGPAHDVVKSPLKDEEPAGDKPDPITSGPIKTEPASNEAAKSDTGTEGRGSGKEEAAGAGPAPEGADGQPGAQNSPAASSEAGKGTPAKAAAPSPAAKPYTDGETYMDWLDAQFAKATTKAAITEVWGSTRNDRNDLCSPEQIDQATARKAAALKKVAGDR